MAHQRKLGTFLGVYTPTILTILGTILYLRSGWLTGHLGLPALFVIILLSNLITFITALSISSAATNLKVGAGGAYYIISRSLGMEMGGAVGVPLFLSQAISVTLYAFGLAETMHFVCAEIPVRLTAFIIVLLVTAISMTGADIALKTQIPVMALVGLSLLALAVGAMINASPHALTTLRPSGDLGFWRGFAIFFPAVTGIMAGLGLSGDLRHPMRAIPRGTIYAVLTGAAIYFIVPPLLAVGAPAEALKNDTMVWARIAFLGPWLILPGLWGAILSSAVGSMLGAPRTLKALADDGLAPRVFRGSRRKKDSMRASFLFSTAIAIAAIFLGNLNAVAVVVTIFFLTVYGTVNLVAALEALSGETSWRPRLRFPWPLHFVGGVVCFAVMFLINPWAGVLAITLELAIWLGYSRKEMKIRWGDARRGLYENLIRWSLIRLMKRPMTPRNWRPNILVYVSNAVAQRGLIRLGSMLSQGRGLVTVCELVEGELEDEALNVSERKEHIRRLGDEEKLVVFSEVDIVKNVVEGIVNVSQANGMAGIESNTVLIGWPRRTESLAEILLIMRKLRRLSKSMLIAKVNSTNPFPERRRGHEIHVWWGGLENNGDLMVLLAYLLTQNKAMHDSRIRINSIASNDLMKKNTEQFLKRLFDEIRIKAETTVLTKPDDRSVIEMIHEQSADASLVILGLAEPAPGAEAAYAERLIEIAGNLPGVLFVNNASLFVGKLLMNQDEVIQPLPR